MSACCVYDFTSFEEDSVIIQNWCIKYAKKWSFQQEMCPSTSNLHFQGRISLKSKKRVHEINKENLKFHFTVTSSENRTNMFYVTKEETRVDGPWSDEDDVKTETKQINMFLQWELRPYQQFIKEQCDIFDMRKIDIVYDPIGNMGKSIFSEYLEYCGLVEEIPPYRLMDDIFQWVYGRPVRKAYFIDMPRGMKKDKLADLYSGIEIIKNGVAYDKRHTPKKKRFDRPRIFVFTNELPCFDLMSKDRWNVWIINHEFSLDLYTRNEPQEDE